MKKRILSMLMAICLVLCIIPLSSMAAPEDTVVKLDVSGENVDNEDYKIDDSRIILRKRDVMYELTGTTDKKISIWGSNNASDIDQAFYIRTNNVEIGGGIIVENSPVKMVLDIPSGTDNTISRVSANDLTIKGTGTLRASSLKVTQKTSYMPSALHITDTKIVVTTPATAGDSSEWNGPCVLDGAASVTYIGGGKYPALKVGVKNGDKTHSVTLKDSAKLYCLQDDMSTPASASVSGLEIFGAADLLMEGNSYLEAEGKDSTGKYCGFGIASYGNVTVNDQAQIKASGYDVAMSISGSLAVSGGTVIADSVYSNGIYADKSIKISNGAVVKASGHYPALFGNDAVSIADSYVEAKATDDVGIFSRGNVEIENSIVKAEAGEDRDGIRAKDTATITGSWIETSGTEAFTEGSDSIANSVLFNGKSGKVIGDALLPGDAEVASDMELLIPEGTSLKVGSGTTFVNHGTVTVAGTFAADGGTVECDSHSGGTATCTKQAECGVCGTAYGDLDAANHTGEAVWTTTETKHEKKYNCCGAAAVAEEDHEWQDGVCSECGYKCIHKGGTATCTKKAVCEICGAEYGELNSANHGMLKHVNANAATKDTEGNIEYWYCGDCGKYFADAQAVKEIKKEATLIAKLPGGGTNPEKPGTGTKPAAAQPATGGKTPDTSDHAVPALWLFLLLVSAGAAAFVVIKQKRA